MKVKGIIAMLGIICLNGCATHSVEPEFATTADQNRTFWTDAAGDSYQIKVIRDNGQMGSLCLARITIDGKDAADLKNGESAVFKVAPGAHKLHAAPAPVGMSLCKTFNASPNMQTSIDADGAAGAKVAYRYSFTSSGSPQLLATSW